MQPRANAEIIVYSGRFRNQAGRDSKYKNDTQKNNQKQSPSPSQKSDYRSTKGAGGNRNQEAEQK